MDIPKIVEFQANDGQLRENLNLQELRRQIARDSVDLFEQNWPPPFKLLDLFIGGFIPGSRQLEIVSVFRLSTPSGTVIGYLKSCYCLPPSSAWFQIY